MKIDAELQEYYFKELEEYKRTVDLTDEEKETLHEWVSTGHSVHENDCDACYEGGVPLDFIAVYREQREEKMKIAAMTEEERKQYLYNEYGGGRPADNNLDEYLAMLDKEWEAETWASN